MRRKAHPISNTPTTAMQRPWRTTTPSPSLHASPATSTSKACHTTNPGASLRRRIHRSAWKSQFSEVELPLYGVLRSSCPRSCIPPLRYRRTGAPQDSGLSVTMLRGGTRPGEEVRDGPHGANRGVGNRGGVAPTVAVALKTLDRPGLSCSVLYNALQAACLLSFSWSAAFRLEVCC